MDIVDGSIGMLVGFVVTWAVFVAPAKRRARRLASMFGDAFKRLKEAMETVTELHGALDFERESAKRHMDLSIALIQSLSNGPFEEDRRAVEEEMQSLTVGEGADEAQAESETPFPEDQGNDNAEGDPDEG